MNPYGLNSVMYVDDEADIREIVAMSLSLSEGTSVCTCESGEQALQMLEEVKPDMVLLDVMMPGMDGPATLQRLRADPALADVPVVFVTAKAMPQEVARFKRLGAVAVIAKPFDPMQLAGQVTRIWQDHQSRSEQLQHSLTEHANRYAVRVLAEVRRVRELIDAAAAPEDASLNELQRLAHNLYGGAATFGFTAVAGIALRLEQITVACIEAQPHARADLLKQCRDLTQALESGLHAAAQERGVACTA